MEDYNYKEKNQKKSRFVKFFFQNKKNIITWTGIFCALYGIFSYFSSGDFSFTLTLGSLIQMFGFALLATKVYITGSVTGLSKNSIISYSICLLFRNFALQRYDGYLPFDATGDFIYRYGELASLVFCLSLLYFMHIKYPKSYNWDLDTFKWYFFAIPTAIIAYIFHPNLNGCFIGDFTWTFALYLESLSMLGQLDVFRKKGGEIEQFTSHFVASSGLSRFLHFVFWLVTYTELNEAELEDKATSLIVGYSGYFVVGFQVIQIILLAEYMYYYFRSLKDGIALSLPTFYQNV